MKDTFESFLMFLGAIVAFSFVVGFIEGVLG